ncbi:unnamed protein product [Caenorhabditis angaria]|uniref:Uncharacterized protein n=1 Tax=Caenorhabditis angaria TaxID=860376 RepID=A0A9P1IVM8_9PELO|nr:unnamed protein product [Caenorhabditis angaria]
MIVWLLRNVVIKPKYVFPRPRFSEPYHHTTTKSPEVNETYPVERGGARNFFADLPLPKKWSTDLQLLEKSLDDEESYSTPRKLNSNYELLRQQSHRNRTQLKL